MNATTAPGKIMLAGEYAILRGARAVVAAIDRRVRASLSPRPVEASTLLAALVDELTARGDRDAAHRAGHIVADSSALSTPDGIKLGLGSSAAVCAAATALALEDTSSVELAEIAHAVHRRAQGGRGSGADVAACVHGGLVAVRPASAPDRAPQITRIDPPAALRLVPVWTGRSADTRELIQRVSAWGQRDPSGHEAALSAIEDASEALIAALGADRAAEAVRAIAAGAAALAELGRRSGIELETEHHRRLGAAAEAAGGALKPTGAGAGDVALAAFATDEAETRFRAELTRAGMTPLAAGIDPRGVAPDSPETP